MCSIWIRVINRHSGTQIFELPVETLVTNFLPAKGLFFVKWKAWSFIVTFETGKDKNCTTDTCHAESRIKFRTDFYFHQNICSFIHLSKLTYLRDHEIIIGKLWTVMEKSWHFLFLELVYVLFFFLFFLAFAQLHTLNSHFFTFPHSENSSMLQL